MGQKQLQEDCTDRQRDWGHLSGRREQRRIVVGGFTDELIMEEKFSLCISVGRAGMSGWKPREADFKSS